MDSHYFVLIIAVYVIDGILLLEGCVKHKELPLSKSSVSSSTRGLSMCLLSNV